MKSLQHLTSDDLVEIGLKRGYRKLILARLQQEKQKDHGIFCLEVDSFVVWSGVFVDILNVFMSFADVRAHAWAMSAVGVLGRSACWVSAVSV